MQIRSYAKINWTLDVLFKREDGYHELRTIYQTLSLYDSIRLSEAPGGIGIVSSDAAVPSDERNLAHKAARLLADALGRDAGVRIEIEKRIPVAAGLGGGSSNAAATLVALVKLWKASVADEKLLEIAASIGSDVPFFLTGGTALGVGRGEEVYPLEDVRWDNLLLANPGTRVATEDAYRRLSRLTRVESSRIMPFTLLAAKGIRELPLVASNDLETVVAAAHPEIAELKQTLMSLGARHALMSGSGATVFGVFDNVAMRDGARDQLRRRGVWAEGVRTIDRREYRNTLFCANA